MSQTYNKRGKSIFDKKHYEFPMFVGKTNDNDNDIPLYDITESKENIETNDYVIVCNKCNPITKDQKDIIDNIKIIYKFFKYVRNEARKIKYYREYGPLYNSSDDNLGNGN